MLPQKTLFERLMERERIAREVTRLGRWLNAVAMLAAHEPPRDADPALLKLGSEAFQKFPGQAVLLLEAPMGLPEC